MCLSSEEYGELFVMEDFDNEGEGGKRKWKEFYWRLVVKEDLYFVKEFFYFSLEEVSLLNLILFIYMYFFVLILCVRYFFLEIVFI